MRSRPNRKIYLWEWPALIARYAWTRPRPIRAIGCAAVGYTIGLCIVGGDALALWLAGLVVLLLGLGPVLASRRPDTEIVGLQKHPDPKGEWFAGDVPAVLDALWSRLPVRAARRFQTAVGVVLIGIGLVLAGWSVGALFR